MDHFLGDDYLLSNAPAQQLFAAVRDLPLIDPHNHANVREIRANDAYPDLWQLEAATDHYFWELLRRAGVAEHLITGSATNEEKWRAAAAVFPDLAANPVYDWTHLNLWRTLGIREVIDASSADRIWQASRDALRRDDTRPQALVRRLKIEAMCSTDDPCDLLEDHIALAQGPLGQTVRPTFRPDKAMNIFKDDWRAYIKRLEQRVNTKLPKIGDLVHALELTHTYFAEHGCVASDHGVEVPYAYDVDEDEANDIYRKALNGRELTPDEEALYMSYLLNEVAAMDNAKGWVFQLHMGAVRDVRSSLFERLGPDSGGDVSDHSIPILEPLLPLLDRFDGSLKMVLYCLDPSAQPTLATLARAFGRTVNLGSGWWFNDTPVGMRTQLAYLAGVDLLSAHAGMTSDSRKLLSYGSRHEMFRRVLCDVVGEMVQQRRMPHAVAERLVVKLSYQRTKELYGL